MFTRPTTTSTPCSSNSGALFTRVSPPLLSGLARRDTSITESRLATLLRAATHSDCDDVVANQPGAVGALREQLLGDRSPPGLHCTVGEGVPASCALRKVETKP